MIEKELPAGGDTEELRNLLNALYENHGIDFRMYAYSSVRRRVLGRVLQEGVGTIAGLQERVMKDGACRQRLLVALTIHVTAMFRDPGFYLAFREQAVPVLKTYPFIRLWVAGCSTGEEVYSLAILLHEEGLYDKCRIYATDVSDLVLERARNGVYPIQAIKEYTKNYQQSGGKNSFADYYTADSEFAVLRSFLRQNIVFAGHNLVGDASFNEFHAIFCRNVMIYFDRNLQDRVHALFYQSLLRLGYLGLGRSENVRFSPHEDCYEDVAPKERLYRKIL